MPIDFTKSRKSADGMIRRWGMLNPPAVLRRASGDRAVIAGITRYNAMEKMGKLIDPVDRKAYISALTPDGTVLDPPPDREFDRIITFVQGAPGSPPPDPAIEHENLRIVTPPGKIAPADTVVMWELQVRR